MKSYHSDLYVSGAILSKVLGQLTDIFIDHGNYSSRRREPPVACARSHTDASNCPNEWASPPVLGSNLSLVGCECIGVLEVLIPALVGMLALKAPKRIVFFCCHLGIVDNEPENKCVKRERIPICIYKDLEPLDSGV
jgi:hypothetical protein